MDNAKSVTVFGIDLPYGLLLATGALILWLPFWNSLHFGQITPILTALLAFGIGSRAFSRGVLVGLVATLKPTYVFLIPSIMIGFGWNAVLGIVLGLSINLVDIRETMTYLVIIPDMHENKGFAGTILVNALGKEFAAFLGLLLSSVISWWKRGMEEGYVLSIGIVTVCTALWYHSYTPIIIPVLFYALKWVEGKKGE